MAVVTCNPPFLKNYSRQSRSPCVAKSGTIYYAYYLAYAGLAVEQKGIDVTHIDAIIDEIGFEETINRIEVVKPSLVVVDTSTPSINSDLRFCKAVKARIPSAVVAVVGTFPTKNTNELFEMASDSFDVCVISEYEQTVSELAEKTEAGEDWKKINGIAYLSPHNVGEVITTEARTLPDGEYLDRLGFVSEFYLRHFGEQGVKRHFYASINWPYVQILSSRGCPFKCTFCNIPSIGSYRYRSVESVVDEMEWIERNMSFVKEIFFEDDTFPINPKRTLAICDEIISRGLKITWSCNARVDCKPHVLKRMAEAGCRLVCVGFESPSTDSLSQIVKKTNIKQQEEFMQLSRDINIKVNGCFIIGLPGETLDSADATIEYAKTLMPNTAQFYPHMLYPGTESFKWAEREGKLLHKDWDKWLTEEGFHNTPLRVGGMEPEDLIAKCDEARIRFYTNPKYLAKMFMQSLKSFKEFQRMMIAGKSFFPILTRSLFLKNGASAKR